MISVMNELEIERKQPAAGLPFFGPPTEEASVSGGLYREPRDGSSDGPKFLPELGSADPESGVGARISDEGGGGGSSERPGFPPELGSADPESGVGARVSGVISDVVGGSFAVASAAEARPAKSAPEECRVPPDHGSGAVGMRVEGATETSDTRVSSKSGGAEARMEEGGAFAAEAGRSSDSSEGRRASGAVSVKEEYKVGSFPSEQLAAETVISDDGNEGSVEVIEEPEKIRVSTWDSSLSVASGASEATPGWMHGLEIGDMVWGKVKSHPWWPGHIFNEALASLSVRRTKREDHVLVAFFGDSSYGWFDLAELIPFDAHYAEKSRQTISRNFVKAVEEAADEASRRRALGLSCRCRNPSNFRPLSVPGYFAVDVEGYEPGVYSAKQIKMERDSFVPVEALSFVNQLAVAPKYPEVGSIDWINKMATLLSLRKALFEEFDGTYAEAFGVQPVRPSRDAQGVLDQPGNAPPRVAPLSGPLVIAEALGERRSKAVVRSAKDPSSKKNKYLFKRREEPSGSAASSSSLLTTTAVGPKQPPVSASSKPSPNVSTKPPTLSDSHSPTQDQGKVHYYTVSHGQQHQQQQQNIHYFPQVQAQNVHYNPHGQANVLIPSLPLFNSSSLVAEADNYVLQKRALANTEKQQKIPAKEGGGKTVGPGNGALLLGQAGQMAEPSGMSFAPSHDVFVGLDVGRPSKVDEDLSGRTIKLTDASASVNISSPGFWDGDRKAFHQEDKAVIDAKEGITAELKSGYLPQAEGQVEGVEASTPMDFEMLPRKIPVTKDVGRVVRKEKVHKRPRADHGIEKHIGEENKNKKRKKEVALEAGTDHPPLKHAKMKKDGESLRRSAGKSIRVGMAEVDSAQTDLQTKVDGAEKTWSPSDSAVQLPRLDLASLNLELPVLISDLAALALDPFHGADRNAPAIVHHVFLRFRSLVYQKSLVLPPESEPDSSEPRPSKFAVSRSQSELGIRNSGIVSEGEAKDQREPAKPMKRGPKPTLKPDDPTKMGRKRMPSDRQEEKSAKRLKKLSQLKALTSDKKPGVGQKAPDAQQRGEKDSGVTRLALPKPMKPDSIKKQEPPPPPPKAAIPTYLVMKFPIRTTLPSVPSLKARFARFGSLDPAGTRVYWKSFTCKVLFKHKSDAQAAYNYARNNEMFGQIKVIYNLREVEDPVLPAPESTWRRVEARADDASQPRMRNDGGDSSSDPRVVSMLLHQRQQAGRLKSILKKPSGDETVVVVPGSAVKETPRVKFMLGDDDGRGEPSVVVSSGSNGGSSVDGTSSSVGQFELNSKTPQSVSFPPTLPPLLPLPPVSDMNPPLLPPSLSRVPPFHDVRDPRGGAVHFIKSQTQPVQHVGTEERESSNDVDVSRQMLNLLIRCSDVVANVKCTLGYVPYHPL